MNHEQALSHLHGAKSTVQAKSAATSLVGTTVSYRNELGSVAQITFNSDGSLSGKYTSAVSSGGSSITGPLTGWYSGDVISFSVLWPSNVPSISTWAGELVAQNSSYVIETLWYLAAQTGTGQFWTAINAGADTFSPIQ